MWAIAVVLMACDGAVGAPPAAELDIDAAPACTSQPMGDEPPAAGLYVMCSDYASTAVDVISGGADAITRPAIVHSGSRDPGLSAALSGDVVLPLRALAAGRIVLIDRYPAAVLTFVNPAGVPLVERQLNVGAGFAANPQDALAWGSSLWVARMNPRPGADRSAVDAGDDLTAVTEWGGVVARVGLTEHADDGLFARPARMTPFGDRIAVVALHLDAAFTGRAGPGLVMLVDPLKARVTHVHRLPGLAGCNGIATAGRRLFVSCSGFFAAGDTAQIAGSAIVAFAREGEGLVELGRIGADAVGAPFGSWLTVGPHALYASSYGRIESGRRDTLWRIGWCGAIAGPARPAAFDTPSRVAESAPFALGRGARTGATIVVPDAQTRTLLRFVDEPYGARALDRLPVCTGTRLPPRETARD